MLHPITPNKYLHFHTAKTEEEYNFCLKSIVPSIPYWLSNVYGIHISCMHYIHKYSHYNTYKYIQWFILYIYIYILAASPLASSGFAAIGCFRASPYGDIYILKNFRKWLKKNPRNFFSKIQNFFRLKPSPDQDWTNKKRIFQIGPSVQKEIGFKHTKIHT